VTDLPMILVVEDDALLQDIVEEALREGGFETALVTSWRGGSDPAQGRSNHLSRTGDRLSCTRFC
jgi:DNA-binding response OmpR family regulator